MPGSDCIQDDGGTWSPHHCAVWVEHMRHPAGGTRTAMLRHPSYPFPGTVRQPGPGDDPQVVLFGALRAIANDYISAIQAKADISDPVVAALRADDNNAFGWLRLAWGGGAADREDLQLDARKSFWVTREHPNMARADRTAVLLAGRRLDDGKSAGGEVGLRVVMHIGVAERGNDCAVRITGASMSNLPRALQPANTGTAFDVLFKYLDPLRARLHFGEKPALRGFAPIPGAGEQFMLFGVGSRDSGARGHSFVALVSQDADKALHASSLAIVERMSHAEFFDRDPASCGPAETLLLRRPTQSALRLDPLRVPTGRLPSDTDATGVPTGERTLKHPDGLFEVRQNRVGNPTGNADAVQQVAAAPRRLRSDHLAAVHAYLRGNELFERLHAYGLPVKDYFRFARLPLLLRHRAAIRPGAGDGNTVNAQVRPHGNGQSLWEDWDPGKAQQLEVNFGTANLSHREWLPSDGGTSRAQHLGLAADRRWAWHEFGHVLNVASFGELEFRFAHSAGDALAAIVCDPDSELAARSLERYATFPWSFLVRRHDRPGTLGWCWCGQRNAARLLDDITALRGRRFGYFQEQLLSSSLFRLYLTIGGATADDLATRRGASDYVVYLILRAVALLGPEGVVPARSPDQFVSALIDADIGTGEWIVHATWPEREGTRVLMRVGGCVHKVIRWAFERQGLYATDNPLVIAEGIGTPPHVDVFIADRRPGPAGGYEPVALSWSQLVTQPWHAANGGIDYRSGRVVVSVGNRGDTDARRVWVEAWALPVDTPIPNEPIPGSVTWRKLDAITPQPRDVGLGATASFEFAAASSEQALAGPHFVVASATCPADRSNIDAAAKLPVALLATPLVGLIANDNNLGLRIIGF